MTTTNYASLPELRGFRLLDTAHDEEADLRAVAGTAFALAALLLGSLGLYVIMRIYDDSVTMIHGLALFAGVLAALAVLGLLVHRWQTRGHIIFNIRNTRRGFRVVTEKKDQK